MTLSFMCTFTILWRSKAAIDKDVYGQVQWLLLGEISTHPVLTASKRMLLFILNKQAEAGSKPFFKTLYYLECINKMDKIVFLKWHSDAFLYSAPWKQRFSFCHYKRPLKQIWKWKLVHCGMDQWGKLKKMLRSTKASARSYFLFLKIEYKLWEALFAYTMPDHMCKPLKGRSSPATLMWSKIKM